MSRVTDANDMRLAIDTLGKYGMGSSGIPSEEVRERHASMTASGGGCFLFDHQSAFNKRVAVFIGDGTAGSLPDPGFGRQGPGTEGR